MQSLSFHDGYVHYHGWTISYTLAMILSVFACVIILIIVGSVLDKLKMINDKSTTQLKAEILDRTAEVERLKTEIDGLNTRLREHERKTSTDEAVNQVGELMQADLQKNQFIAMLAHELRNPLAPILNAVPLLRRIALTPAAADPKMTRIVDMVERNVNIMSRLIDDLLDVSRITSGIVTLRTEIVNFRSVIENSVEAVRTLLQQKNHAVTIHLPFDSKVLLRGDAVRLEQVFTNLFQNAAKYTDAGGKILIECSVQDEHVVTLVTDSGVGIDPEYIEHIWDLFGQTERGLDRTEGGLGLGLTIVKKLVEMHSGTVSVVSEGIGTGSTFSVILPRLGAKMATISLPEGNMPLDTVSKRTILVVDDNVDATDSLQMFLEMCGHEVDVVFEGEGAVGKIAEKTYDVILLDIGLPKLNGYQVCKTLREQGCRAHIIAITGYGQEEDKKKAIDAGFDRHLTKPVNPDHIEQCLHSLVK